MIRVHLETSANEAVADCLMPPFLTLPEVVTWGTRTFKLRAPNTSADTAAIYTEVFAVALVLEAN